MTSAIVTITDRARAVLAFEAEMNSVLRRIDEELAGHAEAIAQEQARHQRAIEVLRTQQQALETAIFRFGAN